MTSQRQDSPQPLDPAERARLLETRPKPTYWRCLDELANSEHFDEIVQQEFPRQAQLLDSLSRRSFLKVVGASLALAGLTSCTPRQNEKILP